MFETRLLAGSGKLSEEYLILGRLEIFFHIVRALLIYIDPLRPYVPVFFHNFSKCPSDVTLVMTEISLSLCSR